MLKNVLNFLNFFLHYSTLNKTIPPPKNFFLAPFYIYVATVVSKVFHNVIRFALFNLCYTVLDYIRFDFNIFWATGNNFTSIDGHLITKRGELVLSWKLVGLKAIELSLALISLVDCFVSHIEKKFMRVFYEFSEA